MSAAGWIALLATAFFGIGLVLLLRTPKGWEASYPLSILSSRGQLLVVSSVLALVAFGVFLLTLVNPGVFSR